MPHVPSDIRRSFAEAGQEHVFQFAETLTDTEMKELLADLESIDLRHLAQIYTTTKAANEDTSKVSIEPFANICRYEENKDRRKHWEDVGYSFIAEGKLATLLLAGGQGTRLGTTDPKGMYNIGMPSGKSLFQLQAERLKRVIDVASKKAGKSVSIPWYIMTSSATDQATRAYFAANRYFGLPKEDVIFFEQEMLPCLTPEGKIIMESKSKVARAPNGNGGMYGALVKSGVLRDLEARGIALVYQYCVDNSLVVMADPMFVGYCVEAGMECAVKVVAKAHAHEAVGVVCMRNGKAGVQEYSEIAREDAERMHAGRLYFNEAHVCMNMYSIPFLQRVASNLPTIPHHVARKKILTVNGRGEMHTPAEPNGWKLEMFIFDAFEHAQRIAAFEVLREEEFSPLKNKEGSDSPVTCQQHLSRLHKSMVAAVGGSVSGDGLFEIAPAIAQSSYDLHDLDRIARARDFPTPFQLKP